MSIQWKQRKSVQKPIWKTKRLFKDFILSQSWDIKNRQTSIICISLQTKQSTTATTDSRTCALTAVLVPPFQAALRRSSPAFAWWPSAPEPAAAWPVWSAGSVWLPPSQRGKSPAAAHSRPMPPASLAHNNKLHYKKKRKEKKQHMMLIIHSVALRSKLPQFISEIYLSWLAYPLDCWEHRPQWGWECWRPSPLWWGWPATPHQPDQHAQRLYEHKHTHRPKLDWKNTTFTNSGFKVWIIA